MTRGIEDRSKEQLIEELNTLKQELAILKERDMQRIHTESALLKTKATAFALLHATSDLAAVLNIDGVILEVNDAVLRRIGMDMDQLVGKNLFDFFPQEFKDFKRVYINIVQQTKEPMRFQDEFQGLILHVCLYPILDSDDEVERLAIFVSDITQHRQSEDLLYRYSQILSTIEAPMAYIDKNFIFRTVNDAYLKIYNKKKKNEIVGHTVEELLGEIFIKKKIKWHIQKCLTGQEVKQQEWMDFPDGQRRFMYMNYYPMFSKEKETTIGVVVNSIDITKMKEMEDKLKRLSITDQLTQIYNRVKFNSALEEEVKRYRRYNTELAIVMLDIDHFKRVNDTYGHMVGDVVLQTVSDRLAAALRSYESVGRYGGEEFLVTLFACDADGAARAMERMRAAVGTREIETQKGKLSVSISLGAAASSDPEASLDDLIMVADEALYEAKNAGRNRHVVKVVEKQG